MRAALLIAAFALFAPGPCLARQAAPTASTQASPPAAPAPPDAAPVPVPQPSEKAMSYYRTGVAWWVFTTFWGLLLPAVFLFTGFSARLRDWARRIGRKWFFVIVVYFILFSVITFFIDLPLAYFQDYARQHAYGLSNQSLGKWVGDQFKVLLVGLVTGVLFLWVPYLLIRRSPRRWWLYTGLAAVPFLILVILVQPVWVDPLFNKFEPMKNKALEARILALAERAGIEGSRVFEVDKSADTKAVNAYVTGFGDTKRIVLWDTAIAKLSEPELLFVMGHEMGHYVLGHVWKTILFFAALIILTLYAIHRTAGWLIKRYERRFGFTELSDIASLPLLILLFGAYFFLITPVALAYTRYNEHEADRFGLEITQQSRPAATAFVKLQEENLGNPRPGTLVKLWRASHPPLGERIDFCNTYRPWERGEPLVYGGLFRQNTGAQ
jgi:STE24 endopeptidase